VAYIPPALRGGRSGSTSSTSSFASTNSSRPSPPRSQSPPPWRRQQTSSAQKSSPSSDDSTPKNKLAGNWRTGAGPLTSSILPTFDDLEVGTVLSLPANPVPADSKFRTAADQNPWSHPVVVLEKRVEDGEQCVAFRTCTSFGGRHVKDAKPLHQRAYFLLADNHTDVVPHDWTRLAKMVGTDKFTKRTYVNLSPGQCATIEYKYLTLWSNKTSLKFDGEEVEKMRREWTY
jgi:hypothetical protein